MYDDHATPSLPPLPRSRMDSGLSNRQSNEGTPLSFDDYQMDLGNSVTNDTNELNIDETPEQNPMDPYDVDLIKRVPQPPKCLLLSGIVCVILFSDFTKVLPTNNMCYKLRFCLSYQKYKPNCMFFCSKFIFYMNYIYKVHIKSK